MEGIHIRGEKHAVHIQCTRARQNSISKELARQKRATLYRKSYRRRKQACSTIQGLFDTLAKKLGHNLMKPSSHCSLANCIDSRAKVQKNGWGDYTWQWLSVIIKDRLTTKRTVYAWSK